MKTKIRELRARFRISQEELGNAVGVTRRTINSVENEKSIASLPLACKIAEYFNLSIYEVFDLEDYLNEIKDKKPN